MKLSLLTVIGGLVAQTIAAPAPVSHIIHEKRDIDSSTWIVSDIKLRRDAIIPVSIGLTQRNLEYGYEFLMDVSDPESPNYGKHWTMEKVAETFKPSDETIAAVRAWLLENGISIDRVKLSKGMNWFKFNATIEEVEALLHTEYKIFNHAVTGQPHVACHEYSVPRELRGHIDFITPTVQFDAFVKERPRKRAEGDLLGRDTASALPVSGAHPGPEIPLSVLESSKSNSLANCNQMITPACLRALYGIPEGEYQLSSYGIVEYTPQAYVPSDLDLFYSNFATEVPAGTRPTVELIDGAIIQTSQTGFGANGESNLDLQYAISLVYPQTVTLYQVGDIYESATFNNFLDAIDGSYCTSGGGDTSADKPYPDPNPNGYQGRDCGTVKPAAVISTSYGTTEAFLTASYARRQCNEYMKLGLAGVTVLYSSGDGGVAGIRVTKGGPYLCCTNPGCAGGAQSAGGIYFNPTFPSTCPYVTSVGATQMVPGSDTRDPEMACETVIYSGGGFSNIFPLPSYQAKAVAKYYRDHNPNFISPGLYNDSQAARGYPDVAANGAFYAIALNGAFSSAFGTSAASPTFGSIITLINERRAHYGKGPVGFINPMIYAHSESFHDVTSGSNPGCGTQGFQAVPDWDPITGLGTPDYERLVDIFG